MLSNLIGKKHYVIAVLNCNSCIDSESEYFPISYLDICISSFKRIRSHSLPTYAFSFYCFSYQFEFIIHLKY